MIWSFGFGFCFFFGFCMINLFCSVCSQCFYCGVGCGLEFLFFVVKGEVVKWDVEGNLMWIVCGDCEYFFSFGQVCIKGVIVGEILVLGCLC